MAPALRPFSSVDELLATAKTAKGIDFDGPLSVRLGCGRQTKYAQRWQWILDAGDQASPEHYSDMITLDGFGRYEICRRSCWDAKGRRYETLDHGNGRFGKFTKATARKVETALREIAKDWYLFHCAGCECYKPTPWK